MRKTIVLPALLFAIAGVGCNPTDAEAPTINSLNLSLNEAYVGETVTVDYDIEDNVTSKENLDVSLTLYYADKEVELQSNTFTINEAVDHSVALIVKDEAGNESSKTVSVEVSNQYSWSAEQNEDIMSTLGLESNPFPLLKEFGDVTLEPTTNTFGTVNYFTVTVEDVDDPIERLGGLLEIAGFKYAEDLSGDTGMEWTDDGTPVIDTVYTLENQFDNEKKVVEAIMEYSESSKTFIYILKNYVYPTTTESTTWDEDALNVALAPYTADQIIVEFTLENPSSDVNFVESMLISQDFIQLQNGQRAAVNEDMLVQLKLTNWLSKFQVQKTTIYSDFSFDEIPKKVFKIKGPIKREPNSQMQDEQFWNSYRKVELTQSEGEVSDFVDKLSSVNGFKYVVFAFKALVENFVETSDSTHLNKVDIGPVNTIYTYNHYDKSRFRISALTNANLNPHFFASGYLAYGTKTQNLYGKLALTYSFNKKSYLPREFPQNNLTVHYMDDIISPFDKFIPTDKDNMFTALKALIRLLF